MFQVSVFYFTLHGTSGHESVVRFKHHSALLKNNFHVRNHVKHKADATENIWKKLIVRLSRWIQDGNLCKPHFNHHGTDLLWWSIWKELLLGVQLQCLNICWSCLVIIKQQIHYNLSTCKHVFLVTCSFWKWLIQYEDWF